MRHRKFLAKNTNEWSACNAAANNNQRRKYGTSLAVQFIPCSDAPIRDFYMHIGFLVQVFKNFFSTNELEIF